jgi:hypothetical protein
MGQYIGEDPVRPFHTLDRRLIASIYSFVAGVVSTAYYPKSCDGSRLDEEQCFGTSGRPHGVPETQYDGGLVG